MRLLFLFILLFILNTISTAQLPKTDVYIADFKNLMSKPQLLSIKYLSGFNQNGYNNQAKFVSYDEIFLSVAMDSQRITDIYNLNLKTNQMYRFTQTEKISEFSPALTPDRERLTTVRIESDGVDQSLWSYPIDRLDKGKRLFPKIKNVGYYTWINSDQIAMFLVGSPNTLVIGDIKSEAIETIIDNVGRCLKTDADGNILFVHKIREDLWMLKSYHLLDKSISTICQMPSKIEDFDVLINHTIVTSDGSMIKTFNPSKDKNWNLTADVSAFGILNIQRPTVYRDRILFINSKFK